MTLSPSERKEVVELAARQLAAEVRATQVDVDELNTLDLSVCAAFLGIPLERATKELPFIELGPRTRRVRIKDYKAYCSARLTKTSPTP